MESEPFTSFGELLRARRRRQHLTQQQVAAQLGVHRSTIGTWERGEYLPDSKGVVLELARLLQLDEQETRQLLEASLTALAPCWSIPYPRNPCFTGREEILEELHRRLSPEQASAVSQAQAICGLGGIGKTQLALEYAYRHALSYSAVFWIGAETLESIFSSLLQVADVLHLPERQEADQPRVVAAVQRWLATHRDWLLIWDNLEDLELLSHFLPSVRRGAILMTTRMQALGTLAQGIELQAMEPEEGLLLLLRRAKVLRPEATDERVHQLARSRPAEYAAASEMVSLLGGLPLALDQAGAYIEETGCSLADYHQHYEQQGAQLLARRGIATGDHPHSVATTLTLIWQRLQREHPSAADLVRTAVWLHAEALPEELFEAGVSHPGPMPGSLATASLSLDLALAALRSVSLVQRHPETRTFSFHRLVQAIVREEMSEHERAEFQQRAVQLLQAAFPESGFEAWGQCERLLPHVLACGAVLPAGDGDQNLAEVLRKAADYLRERAHYEQAEALYQRAGHIHEQKLGGEHPQVAASLNGLAFLYRDRGKYQQAEALFKRALRIGEQAWGPDHPQVATSLNGLALLSKDQGKYAQAEAFYERALRIGEQAWGADHPQTAFLLNGLATLFCKQGKYEQAEAFYKRTLQIWEQARGPNHPQVAYALHGLAVISHEQDKNDQAEPLLEQALRIQEQVWGSDHPYMAGLLNDLATLYCEQGKYEQAEPLCHQALHILEHAWEPEHPTVSYVLSTLAALYAEQGKDEQAEAFYERALCIREKALGARHLQMASPLTGLADLYCKQRKYEQAEPLYQRALLIREQCLGQDHLETARSLAGLARLYEKQKKDGQAKPLLHWASLVFEQHLGRAHPETVQARNDYTRWRKRKRSTSQPSHEEQRAYAQPLPASSRQKPSSLRVSEACAPAAAAQETDPLEAFLATCCELHPRAWSRASALWQAYERWVEQHHERFPLSRPAFIAQLKAHGCRSGRTNAARIWRGITLVSIES